MVVVAAVVVFVVAAVVVVVVVVVFVVVVVVVVIVVVVVVVVVAVVAEGDPCLLGRSSLRLLAPGILFGATAGGEGGARIKPSPWYTRRHDTLF